MITGHRVSAGCDCGDGAQGKCGGWRGDGAQGTYGWMGGTEGGPKKVNLICEQHSNAMCSVSRAQWCFNKETPRPCGAFQNAGMVPGPPLNSPDLRHRRGIWMNLSPICAENTG